MNTVDTSAYDAAQAMLVDRNYDGTLRFSAPYDEGPNSSLTAAMAAQAMATLALVDAVREMIPLLREVGDQLDTIPSRAARISVLRPEAPA